MIKRHDGPGETWRAHWRELAIDCAESGETEAPVRLREALTLLRCAPAELAGMWPQLPDSITFEAMLTLRAYESAALAMVSPQMGYILSRGGNGVAVASVAMPLADQDITACGSTPALALLAALSLAIGGEDHMSSSRMTSAAAPARQRLN